MIMTPSAISGATGQTVTRMNPDDRQQDDLRDGADEKVLRLPGEAGEIAHGQAEAQRQHDERQRQRQYDVGHEAHNGDLLVCQDLQPRIDRPASPAMPTARRGTNPL